MAVDVPPPPPTVAAAGPPPSATTDTAPVFVTITVPPPAPPAPPEPPQTPVPPDVTVPNPIANQSSPEDVAWNFVVPANTFSDQALPLTVTLANGAPLEFVGLSFNAATRTISGTPPTDFNGPIVIMVAAGNSGVSDVFTLNVTAVNDAPTVVGGAVALAPIAEGTELPPGQTVSALLAGSFSDTRDQVAGGSQENGFAGVAISGNAATTQGAWQYFDGANWVTIPGNVSESNALLLSAGTPLRFLPAEGFSGTAPALTVHLVDDSAGGVATGTFVNLAGNTGGATPYSSGTITVNETVTAVNDPPVTSPVTLAPIAEDSGARLITQAELLSNASDPDSDALTAVNLAITSGGGSWSTTATAPGATHRRERRHLGHLQLHHHRRHSASSRGHGDARHHAGQRCADHDAGDTGGDRRGQRRPADHPGRTSGQCLGRRRQRPDRRQPRDRHGRRQLVDNGNGTWSYTPALNDDTSVTFSYTSPMAPRPRWRPRRRSTSRRSTMRRPRRR